MPLLDTDLPTPSFRVTVGASVAVELEWVLAAAGRADWQRDHHTLGTAYASDPGLARRVLDFWGADAAMSCSGFLELLVLAHRGGILLSANPAELFDRLDDLGRHPI